VFKSSELRGHSISLDEPVRCLAVCVPGRDDARDVPYSFSAFSVGLPCRREGSEGANVGGVDCLNFVFAQSNSAVAAVSVPRLIGWAAFMMNSLLFVSGTKLSRLPSCYRIVDGLRTTYGGETRVEMGC
jgi:hypothetical protein